MVEHTAVNRVVVGSSPTRGVYIWGISSVGRAPALQAGGHESESRMLHLCPVGLTVTTLPFHGSNRVSSTLPDATQLS